MKKWSGQTVVVLASGPSLTPEDVAATSHLPTIAVNTSWQIARHCQVLFAGDATWWNSNGQKVDIPALRVSLSYNSERQFGATKFDSKVAKRGGFNSGAIAIEYALANGADRVLMLGFDCSVRYGIHHHGPHDSNHNPTETKCILWRRQFASLRQQRPDAEIINCSRYTELTCFPCMPLEEALCEHG